MNKLALAPLALAFLAACATHDKVTPAPAPVVVAPPQPPAGTVVVPQPAAGGTAVVVAPAPSPLRVGIGTIDTITPVPNSANRRVGVRMADGGVQYFDTAAAGLNLGERVEITSDGYMKRPVP